MAETPKVLRLDRIGLTVADLARTCAFYEQGLGFSRVGIETRSDAGFADLTGIEGARAEVATLRLGGQTIELAAFTPAGRPYPAERAASDPWFQHFAVVTADMAAAYAATSRAGAKAVSDGGPQLLPPATGSITAYKFRDPEGHPLELSWFPPAAAGPAWRDPPAGAVFLGIDHSAIAVAHADIAAAFYVEQLGMRIAARQVNSGPTQARLDGLVGAEVEIVSLAFEGGGPHLELLAYRQPRPAPPGPALQPNDVAATRLILAVQDLEDIVGRLKPDRLVSSGIVTQPDGSRAALIRDPDGHLLDLRRP